MTPHKWQLNARQYCDVELILNKGFSPLSGFMTRNDYLSVLNNMRLSNQSLWPIPITLDVDTDFASQLTTNEKIALCNDEGTIIAYMTITDLWKPDKKEEALKVYGTDQVVHPGVAYLMEQAGAYYIGGEIECANMPAHYDFEEYRYTPDQLKYVFNEMGWTKIVAFQTRNPMHRAHQELTLRAIQAHQAKLLIHPAVGLTKPGDIDHYTRVRCYKKMLDRYPSGSTLLSLLPLAMRMAGPREALWHAIIRKNYGVTHFIVGRDHAGPGIDIYDPYAAQKLVKSYESEINITMIPFQEMVYVKEAARYIPMNEVNQNQTALKISGTAFRHHLKAGDHIPDWFSYPDIISELRKSYPPLHLQGFTLFFTGLSGAGKSTLAKAILAKFMEWGEKPVSLLDGDIVRQHLSSELTFSKEHRDLNIRRIGYIASEITQCRGIAICAPIAPYRATRNTVRKQIESVGGFIEIYVSTPLKTCKQRDTKGLYAKAEAGIIKNFTGVSDPYEPPTNPELIIDTTELTVEESLAKIIEKITQLGYINTKAHKAVAEKAARELET